ncbi:hypothetical protein [Desulfoscipio geothermicus]|uniref:Uncharacterized protein n=1 Tax=Desulfoscipio geothermicus DSM 3669 TaxID=1121426 RepID=A0A1I6DWZ8_9FIRM|nr:hypothetical protein [Desulfoscipio geothermicus]SFR10019.1 hypothetical protein SAMN05660706_12015 [Desulfoscipio geothermicus DSM 3669]
MARNNADRGKRRWFLFLIFAPGIFFILYWFAIQSGDNARMQKVKPPAEYVPLGREVVAGGESFKIFGGDIIFSDTVDITNNNKAVAEPGKVFMGVALQSTAAAGGQHMRVIDPQGRSFAPLGVDSTIVARNFGIAGSATGVYIFKVDSGSDCYFIQVNNNPRLTWRIVNSYK